MNRNKLLKLGHIYTMLSPIKHLIDKLNLSKADKKEIEKKADKKEVEKKVDKITGKGLSTNDYTTEEKDKLAGIAPGATKI